jgi:hypothetical protein
MTVPEVSQDTLWYDRMLDKIIKNQDHESPKLATSLEETTETAPETSSDETGPRTP